MRILLTGGAGFIGHHLAHSLLQKKEVESVVIVDSLHDYYDPRLKRERIRQLPPTKKLSFYEQDIMDGMAMETIFARESPDAIIHLAAIPGVRGSLSVPLRYVEVDVKGTVQMLELARKHAVQRFLFASSSSVYGERAVTRAFHENDVDLNTASPYAASKLSAEVFCRTYASLYGLDITALRFFTVYGPGQRPDMAISRFLAQIEKDEPLTLYDPDAVRDFTYIGDIVDGITRALERASGFQVYNLGGGQPVRMRELIQALARAAGVRVETLQLGPQPGDVSGTWADISAAKAMLEWTPRVGLEEGLRLTCEWWQTR